MRIYHLLPRPNDRGGVTAAVYRLVRESSDGVSLEAGGFHPIALGRYDLVHIHTVWLGPCWTTAVLCRLLKIPYVLTPHGNLLGPALRQSSFRKRLFLPLVRWMCRCADRVVVNSADEKEAFLKFKLDASRIVVIPWGIDSPSDRFPEKAGTVRTVLYLGRISPEKNLEALLDAWRSASPGADWRLRLVGFSDDGGYERKIRRLARSIPGVEVHADCPYRERFETIRTADVLVLPSRCENFGFTVGEALACGVPVLVSDGTPWRKVSERGCGICVGTSPEKLTEGLRSLMALSDVERSEMGQRGREWVCREFSWESTAKRMVEVYEKILSTKDTNCTK